MKTVYYLLLTSVYISIKYILTGANGGPFFRTILKINSFILLK